MISGLPQIGFITLSFSCVDLFRRCNGSSIWRLHEETWSIHNFVHAHNLSFETTSKSIIRNKQQMSGLYLLLILNHTII